VSPENLSPPLRHTEVHKVNVRICGQGPFDGRLQYVGVVETSSQEKLPSGLKRVYWTFGYVLCIMLPHAVDEVSLAAMFTPGDDAKSIYVKKLAGIKPNLNPHHRQLYDKAFNVVVGAILPEW